MGSWLLRAVRGHHLERSCVCAPSPADSSGSPASHAESLYSGIQTFSETYTASASATEYEQANPTCRNVKKVI